MSRSPILNKFCSNISLDGLLFTSLIITGVALDFTLFVAVPEVVFHLFSRPAALRKEREQQKHLLLVASSYKHDKKNLIIQEPYWPSYQY